MVGHGYFLECTHWFDLIDHEKLVVSSELFVIVETERDRVVYRSSSLGLMNGSWARNLIYFTLTMPLSNEGYKWVLVDLDIVGLTLQLPSHSTGSRKACYLLILLYTTETMISCSSVDHLAWHKGLTTWRSYDLFLILKDLPWVLGDLSSKT